MAIIHPTINLVARPGMTLPSPWVFARDASTLNTAELAYASGADDAARQANASRGSYITATTALGLAEKNVLRHDFQLAGTQEGTKQAGQYLGLLLEGKGINRLLSQRTPVGSVRQLTTPYGWTSSTGVTVNTPSSGMRDPATATSGNVCSKLTTTADGTIVAYTGSPGGISTAGSEYYSLSVFCKNSLPTGNSSFCFCYKKADTASNFTLSPKFTVEDKYNWSRYTFKFQAVSFTATSQIGLKLDAGADMLVDFIQLEQGNVTSALLQSSAIRSPESLAYTNSPAVATQLDPYEGTVYIMVNLTGNSENVPNVSHGLFTLGWPTSTLPFLTARIENDASGSRTVQARYATTSETAYATTPLTSAPSDGWYKLAVRYRVGETNGLRCSINGSDVFFANPASLGSGLNFPTGASDKVIRLGESYPPSNLTAPTYLDGTLMHFAYFPKAFSDADLKAITS